jgi:hypothetical protein
MDCRIKLTAAHRQPGRLIDIDSVEDFAFANALLQQHPDVYPYQSDAARVRESVMPYLERNCRSSDIFRGFEARANNYCERSGCPRVLDNGKPVWPLFYFTQKMLDDTAACLRAAVMPADRIV